jgi:hypothetical protein
MFAKGFDISQFFKNSRLKNIIKSIFDINLNHNPIRV